MSKSKKLGVGPCPFCGMADNGGLIVHTLEVTETITQSQILCTSCGARGPVLSVRSPQKAKPNWAKPNWLWTPWVIGEPSDVITRSRPHDTFTSNPSPKKAK